MTRLDHRIARTHPRLCYRTLLAGLVLGGATMLASGAVVAAPVTVSGTSPFSATCGLTAADGRLFLNSEVEPFIAANPIKASNLIAVWQQDRWSNGGSRGNLAGVSIDGGTSWGTVDLPGLTLCSTPAGIWDRATDPWVTFSPNGNAFAFSLVFQALPPPNRPGGNGPNAMVVQKSTDGGAHWSSPITLVNEVNPRVLHDKNSITADPNDSNFVYAVWDKLTIPTGAAINPENVFGFGFKGPAAFSRTTDGGTSWEPIRLIFDPGANNQTIGNQVVVLPRFKGGTLFDFFNEILNFKSIGGGVKSVFNLSFLTSSNKGTTWRPNGQPNRAQSMQSLARLRAFGILTPDTGQGVRTGDILFDVAVDRTSGNLYAVWQDARFSGDRIDQIAFSMSANGGTTWSTPIKVNQTPSVNVTLQRQQAFTPSVEAKADGTILVSYYDFRNDVSTAGQELADFFAVSCPPPAFNCASAASWLPSNEARLTSASFNILDAPNARGFFTGDYEGLASASGNGLAVFGQPQGSDPGDIVFNRF